MSLFAAAEVTRLRRSRRIWQGATGAVTALAATLALYIALAPPPTPSSGLVAVVNRTGDLPALIVRVDPRAGVVQVRELAPSVRRAVPSSSGRSWVTGRRARSG